MKKLLSTVAVGLTLTLGCNAALAEGNVVIFHDGVRLGIQNDIVIKDGRTLLGLRDYFEALGIPVNWSDANRQATVTYEGQTIVLLPDSQLVLLNDKTQVLDVGPQIIDNHIYVPLRFLSETLGYDVDYTQPAVGQAIIQIKTAPTTQTPPATTTDGVTTIAHKGTMNDGDYLLANDLLVGVRAKGESIYIRQFNLKTGEANEEVYNTKLTDNEVTDIIKTESGYRVILNDETTEGYVGVGTPSDSNRVNEYEVAAGKYYLYNGESSYQSINIAANGKISDKGKDSDSGYVMDVSATNSANAAVAYAVDEDGSQMYIVDKQLVIVDKNLQLLYEETLNARVDDVTIVANDGYFFVCALDEQTQTMYTGLYTSGGQVIDGFWRAARIEDERRLMMDQVVADKDNFYVLFSTNIHQYLGEYNTVKREFGYEILDDVFTQLIPTEKGYLLFGLDEENVYLKEIGE